MPKSGKWAVYVLKDPRTGVVRYVGVTSNPLVRRRSHERDCQAARTPLREWLLDLGEHSLIPAFEIMETGEGAWIAAERSWISKFRAGENTLTNLADGGMGPTGITPSAEAKNKKRESQLGGKRSEKFCERMREVAKRRPPQFWEDLAARNRAAHGNVTAEGRAKQSAVRRGKPWSAARRAKWERTKGGGMYA